MASRSAIISVPVSASGAIRTTAGTYYGLSVRDTASSGAVIRVWDNASAASGTLLETVKVAASSSFNIQYNVEDNSGGIRAVNGIYFELVSGTIEGSIRVS